MSKPPVVFISYSWDSKEHREWVLRLSNFLMDPGGIDVKLDRYELSAGNNKIYFMEMIEKADKVVVVLTPSYKNKADERVKGVGFEYSLITQELFRLQKHNDKFIPVLRVGDEDSSIPGYLKTLMYHDFRNNDRFESDAIRLAELLWNESTLIKPQIAEKPDFQKLQVDPNLEIVQSIVDRRTLKSKKKSYLESHEAYTIASNELNQMKDQIVEKADLYKTTGMFFKAGPSSLGAQDIDEFILNATGVGLNILTYDRYRTLPEMTLEIRLWDMPLSFELNAVYYPKDPTELSSLKLFPVCDDNMNIVWSNEEQSFKTNDLGSFIFGILLEQAKKQE